jgi:RES domain
VPDLPAGYLRPLAPARPVGLRRRRVNAGTKLWRLDGTAPTKWTWDGFSTPRFRFDPETGAFRTRYAASTLTGAFRERYQATGRVIPKDHATHYLVELEATRHLLVLDLRTEANLDTLDVDDQINTGQHPDVWRTCNRLADAVQRWWNDLDALVYRSRTTPESSVNYAIFSLDAFSAASWELAQRDDILDELVLHQDFTVRWKIGGDT